MKESTLRDPTKRLVSSLSKITDGRSQLLATCRQLLKLWRRKLSQPEFLVSKWMEWTSLLFMLSLKKQENMLLQAMALY
ncbi:hypothetical protein SDC9_89506 [bioreactor metagenome]|uniref:TFIIS N-terminal domain-containing protein n=1 Tax=bioreactor metagenome TaxID=1076179 RepID=A0A644ZZ56_9ZZZZ